MANQMTITFNVENQILSRTDTNRIVEKAKNYVNAHFEFNELWDDTQKAAIIENGGMRFKVYLENNECDIPNRAVSHDGFTITIVGEDEEKNITITTTDLFIAVQKNNASDIQEEYIKNITSDTLDLTREGENCNIEIPSEYVTDEKLSQELESYVDNESLEETLDDYAKETDLSIYATKQELNEKSKVVANPTLSGNEETLEGAEIDGIKYKVGGGKLYQHSIKMIGTGATAGDRLVILNMLSYSNQPKTWNNVKTYCTNLQQATGWLLAGGENRSIHSVETAENANRLVVYYGGDGAYAFMPEPTSLTDTITEVE